MTSAVVEMPPASALLAQAPTATSEGAGALAFPSSSSSSAPPASSSSGSSLFTAKLHRELLKMPDVSWRMAFIDYQRLRKQIKKIVYYEQEQEAKTHPTATQRSSAAPPTAGDAGAAPQPQPQQSQQHSQQQLPSSADCAPSASASPSSSSPDVGGAVVRPSPSLSPPPPSSASLPLASSPASAVAPSSAQRDRLRKARDVFWCVLKAEIDKVNAFFTAKEEEANKQFRAIAMDVPEDPSAPPPSTPSPALDTDRLIFAKLLFTQHPRALAERLLPPALLQLASSVDWATFPPARVSRVSAFLSLCSMVDALRKFVVINYVVVLKVLKKYADFTHRNAKDEFLAEVDSEPFFTSARLAALLQRAEAITFRLLYTGDNAAPDPGSGSAPADASHPLVKVEQPSSNAASASSSSSSPCPICRRPLSNPVQLQCDHRCCFNCLAQQTVDVARSFACPVCSAQQEFDSLDLGLESVLTKFAGVSLTDRERMEGEHTYTQQPQQHPPHHPALPRPDGVDARDVSPDGGAALHGVVKVKNERSEAAAASTSPASVHRQLLLQSRALPFELPSKADGGDGESSGDESEDSEGSPDENSVHPSSSHKRGSGTAADASDRKSGRGSCHQCQSSGPPTASPIIALWAPLTPLPSPMCSALTQARRPGRASCCSAAPARRRRANGSGSVGRSTAARASRATIWC